MRTSLLKSEKGKRKEEKGLIIPGKTKSEAAVAVNRAVVVAVRRTHPPRSAVPRTPAKGVSTGINRTLLLTSVVALLVLRTRPLSDVAKHVVKSEGVGYGTPPLRAGFLIVQIPFVQNLLFLHEQDLRKILASGSTPRSC